LSYFHPKYDPKDVRNNEVEGPRPATKARRDGKRLYIIGLRRPRALPWAVLGQAFGL
jgi:hypothetical protein